MNKRKSIICTILLFVVEAITIFALSFIKSEVTTNITASMVIMPIFAGLWCGDKLYDFYKWLRRNDEE